MHSKYFLLLHSITMEGLRKRTRPHFAFNRDMKHGLHYYETLQKALDARATKKADILLRQILGQRSRTTNTNTIESEI